jgi:hypothetical protein
VSTLSPYFSYEKPKSIGKCSSSLHNDYSKKKSKINLQLQNIVKNATLKMAYKAYNNSLDYFDKKLLPKSIVGSVVNACPHSPKESARIDDIKMKLNKEIIQKISSLQLQTSRKPKVSFPFTSHKMDKSDKSLPIEQPKTTRKAPSKQSVVRIEKDISIHI